MDLIYSFLSLREKCQTLLMEYETCFVCIVFFLRRTNHGAYNNLSGISIGILKDILAILNLSHLNANIIDEIICREIFSAVQYYSTVYFYYDS